MSAPPHITVVMGVLNGAGFLPEMLDSLAQQTCPDWSLLASDDGSQDGSRAILERFAARMGDGRVTVVDGPRRGFAANFLSALARLSPEQAGHLAFADQDDVWLPERLSAGLRLLADHPAPRLVAGPVWVASGDMTQRRLAGGWPRAALFRNALVQNVVQGNTMMANPAATRLLIAAARRLQVTGRIPVAHDWWAYQIITGAGGRVLKLPNAHVLYRQHERNLIGANDTLRARIRRLARAARGGQRSWLSTNLAVLRDCADLLTPEALAALNDCTRLHESRNPIIRHRALVRLRPFRQTRRGTLALWVAGIVGGL